MVRVAQDGDAEQRHYACWTLFFLANVAGQAAPISPQDRAALETIKKADPDKRVRVMAGRALQAVELTAKSCDLPEAEDDRTFEPEDGFPAAYVKLQEQLRDYDGRGCTRETNLLYKGLEGIPLDFSRAAALTPRDLEDWLDDHGLDNEYWVEENPGRAPLAFFKRDQVKEFLVVDANSRGCPVYLFLREGSFKKVNDRLVDFLKTLK